MAVLGSFNREEGNIPEGCSVDILPFNQQEQRRCYAYSKLLMKDAIPRKLEVTQLNVKVFLEEDINYLKFMADISSDMRELDRTKDNMGFLSVPSS
ncbi:hypothetical protein KEH51_25495 [[Brevibacterium] frigoritolerans]|uniref:Uncharacterized protein n=1 Tax=Peribacillus frigoritolerans TaxID=450367 RepID=A0A941FR12_9BACI|nr:hypothetical protein [Peribacillus frigoritolerans]